MGERDIAQSAEVERDAFPTLFPPTAFRRELKNKNARYLVASRTDENGAHPSPAPAETAGATPLFNRLVNNFWRRRNSAWQPGQEFVAGFVGIWYMVDEAHIVAIGVRNEFRGFGIGELMLIAAIEQATQMEARVVTLEVRVSNFVAQNLYKKFGFSERGIRKSYYTDNREDALIMTTSTLNTPDYNQQFMELVQAHQSRWGRAGRTLF
jgi:ribosomal-protein-alanine N-acetyltransferase